MKMWILTADGKNLMLAKRFKVEKNIGGKKDQKWAVTAYGDMSSLDGIVIAAHFPDEKTALDELMKISKAIEDGQKFYRFEETEYNRYA